MINKSLIEKARWIAQQLSEGKQLVFKAYVGSDSTAAYDITVVREPYAEYQKRQRAAAEELKKFIPSTADESAAKTELLAKWTGQAAGENRGPSYTALTDGEETFGGFVTFIPGRTDACYVREIRQVSKVLVAGEERPKNSRPLTIAKEALTKHLLDGEQPHLFQLKVTLSQDIVLAPNTTGRA